MSNNTLSHEALERNAHDAPPQQRMARRIPPRPCQHDVSPDSQHAARALAGELRTHLEAVCQCMSRVLEAHSDPAIRRLSLAILALNRSCITASLVLNGTDPRILE